MLTIREEGAKSVDRVMMDGEDNGAAFESVEGPSSHPLD